MSDRFNGSIAISLFATRNAYGAAVLTATIPKRFQWLNRHKPLCNRRQRPLALDQACPFQWLNRHKPLCNDLLADLATDPPLFQWLNRHKPLCNCECVFLVCLLCN